MNTTKYLCMNHLSDTKFLAQKYKDELLQNIIPFWTNHSIDKIDGGFYTCLDRDGRVFDTDKFIWLQGRQTWMFAMLYNNVEPRQEWLDIANHGADFLKKHGRAEDGTWYFSLSKIGQPLVQPYNIFSDCFAAQAFGQLYKASKKEQDADLALATFKSILSRQNNTKRNWSKSYPGTRPLKNFALPMILSNLSLELAHLLDGDLVNELSANCINEVMNVFYDDNTGLILENVNPDGSFSDSFEGRCLNPGHAIEAMWFLMDLAEKNNDANLINKTIDIILTNLDYAWDEEHGGIYYFLDIKGNPPQQLEWNQKLWWVHIETLIALLKAIKLTNNEACKSWYEKLHDYTWQHFKDDEYGEWYGYLTREGKPLLCLKGGKWKGCYHVPRGMYQCWKTLESI